MIHAPLDSELGQARERIAALTDWQQQAMHLMARMRVDYGNKGIMRRHCQSAESLIDRALTVTSKRRMDRA